jgi:hypothetical protein
MTVVGVTGHSTVTEATAVLVRACMQEILSGHAGDGDLTGISCLGRGPDQIFAQLVLDLGGRLEAVIPASDYDQIPDPVSSARYQGLLGRADSVHRMPFATSGPDAYLAASKDLIRRSDFVIAVWDGEPPDGRGGTADAVEFARCCGRHVVVVWPAGAERG